MLFAASLGWSERASAASACTAWISFEGPPEACMAMIARRTSSLGFRADTTRDTHFFWFGDNVVTARCISEKGVIALAAYHQQNGRACPLSDQIRTAIER
jgi:hypothetical protein